MAILAAVDRPVLLDALRRAWGPDTCAPEDRERWAPENPATGQCITVALVVHDALGGSLIRAEVHHDGCLIDYHWWNRLPDGEEIDLTREQFRAGERLLAPVEVVRPADPGRVREQYETLRARTHDLLGSAPTALDGADAGPRRTRTAGGRR